MSGPRSFRLSSWVNEINPVNWKTVLVGYMQTLFTLVVMFGWLYFVIKHPEKGMQTEVLYVVAGLLAGLSGFTLAGRVADRTTDYGYVERKNAGKALDAARTPAPQVQTGDGAQVNVTATMPAVAPLPGSLPMQRASGAVPRASVAITAAAPRVFDPGA